MSAETDTQAAEAENSLGVTPEYIKRKLIEKLEAEYVDVEDMSGMGTLAASCSMLQSLRQCAGGCGQAFEAIIVSPLFVKKTSLARHRLVNTALKVEIAAIHAWTPKCLTPEEWQKKKVQEGVGMPQGV